MQCGAARQGAVRCGEAKRSQLSRVASAPAHTDATLEEERQAKHSSSQHDHSLCALLSPLCSALLCSALLLSSPLLSSPVLSALGFGRSRTHTHTTSDSARRANGKWARSTLAGGSGAPQAGVSCSGDAGDRSSWRRRRLRSS